MSPVRVCVRVCAENFEVSELDWVSHTQILSRGCSSVCKCSVAYIRTHVVDMRRQDGRDERIVAKMREENGAAIENGGEKKGQLSCLVLFV